MGQEVFNQLKAKGEIIESSPLYEVISTPSHYRLQPNLNDQQEEQARRVFTDPW